MKKLIAMMALLMPLLAVAKSETALQSVDELLWKNRVVIIWSDQKQRFTQLLEDSNDAIEDRDIVWFIINKDQVDSNYSGDIASEFAANTSRKFASLGKKVLLIGKDGGVKNQDDRFYLEDLFDQIDTMPMRKNEMRERTAH